MVEIDVTEILAHSKSREGLRDGKCINDMSFFPLDIALGVWEYKGYFMERAGAFFNGGDQRLN